MNYRELLLKYMWHVGECEGIDFTDRLNGYPGCDVEFEDEEVQELRRISGEVRHRSLLQYSLRKGDTEK